MNLQKNRQENILEFSDSKLSMLISSVLAIIMFGFSVFAISNLYFLLSILTIGMCAYFVFVSVDNFVSKLVLDEAYLEEKSLLKRKKIDLNEIVEIEFGNNNALIKSSTENILVGGHLEDSKELVSHLVLKGQENSGFRLVGDLIAIYDLRQRTPEIITQSEQKTIDETTNVSVLKTELIEKKWLFRAIKLNTTNGEYLLTYFGRGEGFECVLVNEEVVAKEKSVWWYCPKFTFKIANLNFTVNVRVYPWLRIRKFWIEADGQEIYIEGF